jgi:hypothetical protein
MMRRDSYRKRRRRTTTASTRGKAKGEVVEVLMRASTTRIIPNESDRNI